ALSGRPHRRGLQAGLPADPGAHPPPRRTALQARAGAIAGDENEDRIANGEWRMANGKAALRNGRATSKKEWQVANRIGRDGQCLAVHSPFAPLYSPFALFPSSPLPPQQKHRLLAEQVPEPPRRLDLHRPAREAQRLGPLDHRVDGPRQLDEVADGAEMD